PSISLYVKLEITADDQNKDYACLQFPATITSGSAQERNLVDKMAACLDEKFESLESILAEHLPADVLAKVNLSLRGPGSM
ncbi:unnamed protein product, partial [Adineta steineri]